jgi:hypothetical protein
MIYKKFLDFPQTTVNETLQLSKKDFKDFENNNDNDIKEVPIILSPCFYIFK